MVEQEVVIAIEPGLQARPAAQFVQMANNYTSDIYIDKDNKRVNAKSIMGLMSLVLTKGSSIRIVVDGNDQKEALNDLVKFVEAG
ncbi:MULTISPECIES: HPr family phosphocarrier protein [Gracilibacillus]|uniref:HPr family phosphocarrier protein n=1 Tax=Gracilibacillus TaxID=74385 RepID=UPI000826E7FD|nr:MULTISPECIES: HPr family phosphocarrier protein [Gracilibacillus]